jgi:hypothetical protein
VRHLLSPLLAVEVGKLSPKWFFECHTWETKLRGSEHVGHGVTVHVGRLKLIFGERAHA